jgi:hypothetical protein
MKSAGVFLGGLGSVLACNLMLVGVCSSAPSRPAPPPVTPPPPPPPPVVLKVVTKTVEAATQPVPLGLFMWGCGGRMIVDTEGALPLPVCPPLLR